MMRAGAERTSTPVYVTFGIETCMLHGRQSPRPLEPGELAVIDLTPQVEGYCANLARTFVLGEPGPRERALLDAYADVIPAVRDALRPGATVADLDGAAAAVLERHGLGEYQVNGIGHGLGLRFEETPASTIIPPHRNVPLREGMTMTIGHTILAIPGLGGVRHEDVYRVTPSGGEILAPTRSIRSSPPEEAAIKARFAGSRVIEIDGGYFEEDVLPPTQGRELAPAVPFSPPARPSPSRRPRRAATPPDPRLAGRPGSAARRRGSPRAAAGGPPPGSGARPPGPPAGRRRRRSSRRTRTAGPGSRASRPGWRTPRRWRRARHPT